MGPLEKVFKGVSHVEKREPLCSVGGIVNWCSHYGEHEGSLKKLEVELPHDPALLITYLKDMKLLSFFPVYVHFLKIEIQLTCNIM